jgi:hypothetical protein
MEDREPYSSGYEEDHSEISSQHGRNTPSYRSKSPYHNSTSQLRYSHETKVSNSDDDFIPSVSDERVNDGSDESLNMNGIARYDNIHDFSPRVESQRTSAVPTGQDELGRATVSESTIDNDSNVTDTGQAKYSGIDDLSDVVEVAPNPTVSTNSSHQKNGTISDDAKETRKGKRSVRINEQEDAQDSSNSSVEISGIARKVRRDTYGPTMWPKVVGAVVTLSDDDAEDVEDSEYDEQEVFTHHDTEHQLSERSDSMLRSVLKSSDSICGERTSSRVHFHDQVDEFSYPSPSLPEKSVAVVEQHQKLWDVLQAMRSSGEKKDISSPPCPLNTPEASSIPKSEENSQCESESFQCGPERSLPQSAVSKPRSISVDIRHNVNVDKMNNGSFNPYPVSREHRESLHQYDESWPTSCLVRPFSPAGPPSGRRNSVVEWQDECELSDLDETDVENESTNSMKVTTEQDSHSATSVPDQEQADYQRTPSAENGRIHCSSIPDATPSELLDKVETRETRQAAKAATSPYVDSIRGTPSALYAKVQAAEKKKASHSSIPDTTPSKLLDKVETRETRQAAKTAPSPSVDFTGGTPSALYTKVQAAEKKASHSSIPDTTPSELLDKVETRETRQAAKTAPSPSVDFTGGTPSALYTMVLAAEKKRTSHSCISDARSTEIRQAVKPLASPSADFTQGTPALDPNVLLANADMREPRQAEASPSVELTEWSRSAVFDKVLTVENKRIPTLYERVQAASELLSKIGNMIFSKVESRKSTSSCSLDPTKKNLSALCDKVESAEKIRDIDGSVSGPPQSEVHFKVDSSEAHHPNLEHWIHGREYHTVDVVSQDGSNANAKEENGKEGRSSEAIV